MMTQQNSLSNRDRREIRPPDRKRVASTSEMRKSNSPNERLETLNRQTEQDTEKIPPVTPKTLQHYPKAGRKQDEMKFSFEIPLPIWYVDGVRCVGKSAMRRTIKSKMLDGIMCQAKRLTIKITRYVWAVDHDGSYLYKTTFKF